MTIKNITNERFIFSLPISVYFISWILQLYISIILVVFTFMCLQGSTLQFFYLFCLLVDTMLYQLNLFICKICFSSIFLLKRHVFDESSEQLFEDWLGFKVSFLVSTQFYTMFSKNSTTVKEKTKVQQHYKK